MRLLLNKRLHVNMGNFEHVELVATVEVNTETDADILKEHWVSVENLEQVRQFIKEQTDLMLEEDTEEVMYDTKEEDSFIHEYHKAKYQKN